MVDSLKIKGVIYLFLVPACLVIMAVLYVILPTITATNFLIAGFYTTFLFFVALSAKNKYNDSEVMDKVVIPNAPSEVDELLRKKTRTNRLINVNLIDILGKRRKLSQSEIVDEMKKRGIEYSQPAIEKYLAELETAGVIESKKAYKKESHLTEKGKWCYLAVNKCFPKRFFFFLLRHYLGLRHLPVYPDYPFR